MIGKPNQSAPEFPKCFQVSEYNQKPVATIGKPISFLKLSFGQKRKTLWNNLKVRYQPAELRAALEKAGVKPTVRAEALSLEKTAALFRALATASAE